MRRAALVFAGVFAGAGGVGFWFTWPVETDTYLVRLAQPCVPDSGVSFQLNYSGKGTAVFKVVPPETHTETHKKEVVK